MIFEINTPKRVDIQKLINEPINANWTFHWYACKDKLCTENVHNFYTVNGLFVDTNQEVWTHNSFAEYNFLEPNFSNAPYYIWVAVNYNDGSEICYYFTEVRVFGGICDDKINFDKLNCLEPDVENEIIVGTLCTSRSNLKAIRLSVSNNSIISFNRQTENNRNSVTVSLTNVSTELRECCSNYPLCYQFEIEVNTRGNGGYGRIEITLIDEDGNNIQGCIPIYEFFIDPIFTPQIECRSDINSLLCHETDLEVCKCINDIRFDKENYYIKSILDLTLFRPIINKLRFVYSIGIFTDDNEIICFENNTFCHKEDTFDLDDYHIQAGWTLKLPICPDEILTNNIFPPKLNTFNIIHNIKGSDLVVGSDNRTIFSFDISRDELYTLSHQFKQVNYFVRLSVERMDTDIMCPEDKCKVLENGTCCCDDYMLPIAIVDGKCPCGCRPGVLCLCHDGTTCDSHPDCNCDKCFCPSNTLNPGMVVNCDEIETKCNIVTVCKIICNGFVIATLPSNPFPTLQQIKNALSDSRCQVPNAIIIIECPNGNCNRICNCCDELTLIPYNCFDAIPDCPICPPCLCECPPDSNNPGLQVPCNNMKECYATEWEYCNCDMICPEGTTLVKTGRCGQTVPVGNCNCSCGCRPDGCNECLSRDTFPIIDYYWEKCCGATPLDYRDPEKGMCLNHYLNNCDGKCEEEFGCIDCGTNFKLPITSGIGIFDVDRVVNFSEVFKHYERTICDTVETRCIIDMVMLSESLMKAMGIFYDLDKNNETIQRQRIEPNFGLNAVYSDNGVIKNEYQYLAPINNGVGTIYGVSFDFNGINFYNDGKDRWGIINQNIFTPYWKFNGGKELEKCNFDCKSLYSDRWIEFLIDYQDIIDVNDENRDFEDWMLNSSDSGNLSDLKQFVYDKLRDKVNSHNFNRNTKPLLNPFNDLKCPGTSEGTDDATYRLICDCLNKECRIHSKVKHYKSKYETNIDGYILFEHTHLSGEEELGWNRFFELGDYTKVDILLDDEPIFEFGDEYENCEVECGFTSPPTYRIIGDTNCPCTLTYNDITPTVDIQIRFKPNDDSVIFEIIANSEIKTFIINKNSNKVIKINAKNNVLNTTFERELPITLQTNGIITFVNDVMLPIVSRFGWQSEETWECDFNRKYFRAENQQQSGTVICNDVSNTWTPVDDIRTIRPYSMSSVITHYTTIPDYSLTNGNNLNGLQSWATHPILAARAFKCRYNDCVANGKINPNETSIYQYLVMIYLAGCDICDDNVIPPIEDRQDGILLKVFKLNEQRRYIRDLKNKFEEYMLQFDKLNENCNCRYSENANTHIPEIEIILEDSFDSYDYWCWETYHSCERQGFDTTCGCITCPKTIKGIYSSGINNEGYRLNEQITTLFDEVATLNQCGKECNNDTERDNCPRCCVCITDIAMSMEEVGLGAGVPPNPNVPYNRIFGGINTFLFDIKCECDCLTREGFKCGCEKPCYNDCPSCVEWCDAEIETPIWQAGDVDGQYGSCWKLYKCPDDSEGQWVACDALNPLYCPIDTIPCPFACSDFLDNVGMRTVLTDVFNQLSVFDDTDLVNCDIAPIPNIITIINNSMPVEFQMNCNDSEFSNIGEFKEKIYDFIEYMTGDRNCRAFDDR